MIIPFISLLVWGWLNQNVLVSIVIILLLASRFVNSWRWTLKVEQFYRIGDFVTVLFVLAMLYFSVVHTEQRPVFIILEWLPIFFLPIMLTQLYSINNQLPIGILFYSMRKRERVSYLDFKFPYAAICLLGAGAVHDTSLTYFGISIAIFCAILWTVRSKNSLVIVWLVVISLAVVLSFFGQQGLRHLHTIVEEQSVEWLSDWQTDPFKSMTSIGDIGELKLSNKIEFRVKAEQPLLLMQSSYDRYLGKSWFASKRIFSDKPNYSKVEKSAEIKQLEIFQSRKRATVLALPSGTVDIKGLEGGQLQYTPLGAVKLTDAPDYVNYQVFYTGQTIAEAHDFDLQLPEQHLSWIVKIKQQLKLENKSPTVIARTIKQFFQQNYYYSLFLGEEPNAEKALETFMLKRKAGHCEYFAVASTLLLRSYGIPARLANGYAMDEFNESEQMYIVRRRHAHAWSIAYINGIWQEVDSTPSQWLSMEEEQVDLWQPVYDVFSSLYFSYKQWRYQLLTDTQNDNKEILLVIVGGLLLILLWRLLVSRKHLITRQSNQKELACFDYPGKDSELYQIEQVLLGTASARLNNEPITVWAKRINDSELYVIGKMHYQYRFDNSHFSIEDRRKLKLKVRQWFVVLKERNIRGLAPESE